MNDTYCSLYGIPLSELLYIFGYVIHSACFDKFNNLSKFI